MKRRGALRRSPLPSGARQGHRHRHRSWSRRGRPGSIGPRRTYEKRVTLAVSQKLATLIDREPGMRAVLTRRGDYFVDLNKRSEIARKAKADLLVSVHADSFHNSTPRGASVWVLSTNRANREMGSWLEKQEKQGNCWGRWQGIGRV